MRKTQEIKVQVKAGDPMSLHDHQSRAGRGNKGKPKSPEHRAKLANILEMARAAKRRRERDAKRESDND